MSIDHTAALMYGVPLPAGIDDDPIDDAINANSFLAQLGHARIGETRYLTATYHDAELGIPVRILDADMHPRKASGRTVRLLELWEALGLDGDAMPNPAWILAVNQT
jgi:hypothetical protein